MHVWRADLTAVTEDLRELLSPAEHARAARFPRERDSQLWARARGLLKALLGRYLASAPHTLRFASGPHGKPALIDDPPGAAGAPGAIRARSGRLSFNMSHSGQLALYAFTETGAVGVDVEVARRTIDEVAVAARAFGPAEARRLAALDPAIREQEFLRAWARHEAELKWRGTGIGGAGAGAGGREPTAGGREPWIVELEAGPRAPAAVALDHAPRELRCWDLANVPRDLSGDSGPL